MSTPHVPRYEPLAEGWAFWRETVFRREAYEPQLSFVPEGAQRGLDLGCGHGILTFPLAEHVSFAVGMDLAFSMIALARRKLRDPSAANVAFLVGDVAAPPFRAGTFDFVLSVNVLHHSDVERSLPAIKALLTARGRVAVTDVIALRPRLDGVWAYRVWRAITWMPANVRRGGLRAGLKILRFHLSADWLRRNSRAKPTLTQFHALYSRHFPGCTFGRNHAWSEAMFWEVPGPDTRPAGPQSPNEMRVSAPAPRG